MSQHLNPESAPSISRRRFLRWSIGGVLSLLTLDLFRLGERFLSPPLTSPQPAPVAVPEAGTMAVGDTRYVAEARAYLMRDEQGFFALSAICTHLGCLVDPAQGGLQCHCHGSRYDSNGQNLSGPAPRPLAHLALAWGDEPETLVVDPNKEVGPEVRLAPPVGL